MEKAIVLALCGMGASIGIGLAALGAAIGDGHDGNDVGNG